MVEPTEKITDIRLEFIKEYCTRSLRVKPEKWDRIMISDEQRSFIMGFIERQTPQVNIINKNVNKSMYFLCASTHFIRLTNIFFIFRNW